MGNTLDTLDSSHLAAVTGGFDEQGFIDAFGDLDTTAPDLGSWREDLDGWPSAGDDIMEMDGLDFGDGADMDLGGFDF